MYILSGWPRLRQGLVEAGILRQALLPSHFAFGAFVFFVGAAKDMRTIAARDKIQILRGRGIERGQ